MSYKMTNDGGGHQSDTTPKTEQQSLDFWVQLALWGAILVSLGVGITTLFGVKDVIASSSLVSWISAIAVTLVLTVVVAISWHQLIKLSAKGYSDPRIVAYILIAGLVMTGFMIGTSAQFLAGRIGGDAAMHHHKLSYLEELTSEVSVVEQQMRATQQRVDASEQAGGRLQSLLNCEVQSGCVTGRAGPGPVTRTIQTFLDSFGGTKRTVNEEFAAQRARLTEVRGQLEIARDAARTGDDQEFAASIAIAHAILSEARGKASVDFLQSNPLVNSSVPQVAAIGADLAHIGGTIKVAGLSKPVPVFEEMGRQEATLAYGEKVSMAWVLAVCLDAMPLFLLCLTLLSAQIRRGEDLGRSNGTKAEPAHPADNLFSFPGE